jgi:hypothetical protein
MSRRYWTKELVFDSFQRWEAEYGRLPKSKEWKKTRPDRQYRDHPSSRHVANMFGGWRLAVQEYEVERGNTKKRWKKWQREEILEAIRLWAEEHGHPPNTTDVNTDHAKHLPSLRSVERYYPSLAHAIRAAGLTPLPPGVSYEAVARYQPLPRKG